MKRLAIIGASGHGLVVADTAQQCGWRTISFFDDAWPEKTSNGAWPVLGNTSALCECLTDYDGVVVGIGSNLVRVHQQRKLRNAAASIISIIHPSAVISPYARIGVGCVVFAGAVVNAEALIGDGVILNTGCSVDHDCILENYVHISPGAHLAGNVRVREAAWVGIGATVREGTLIGRRAIVGAGAAVVSDVEEGQCVVGVPARPKVNKGTP